MSNEKCISVLVFLKQCNWWKTCPTGNILIVVKPASADSRKLVSEIFLTYTWMLLFSENNNELFSVVYKLINTFNGGYMHTLTN